MSFLSALTALFIGPTSQAAEQCNKTHLTWPKNKLCLLALVFTGVITLSWGHALLKDRENVKFGPGK